MAKPTRGELQVCLEVLAKKKRRVKRKSQASPEGCPSTRGNILKARASSLPSPTVRARGSSGGGCSFALFGGSSYFGLESHVTGRRAPFCNAGGGEEGSLWCFRG